jgi:putative acetyltransferase
MTYQRFQPTEDITRSWAIAYTLPDARHYPVAKFFNRRDAGDHLRLLCRFVPASEFKIVSDRCVNKQDNSQQWGGMP